MTSFQILDNLRQKPALVPDMPAQAGGEMVPDTGN